MPSPNADETAYLRGDPDPWVYERKPDMPFDPGMSQRVALVVEQNKSGSWSLAAYLVSVSGQRERRGLAVRDSYPEAAALLRSAWEKLEIGD
jgi:hypothetical protein